MSNTVTALDDIVLDDIVEAALLAAGEPLPLERLETLFLEANAPRAKSFVTSWNVCSSDILAVHWSSWKRSQATNCAFVRGFPSGCRGYGMNAPSATRGRCWRHWH